MLLVVRHCWRSILKYFVIQSQGRLRPARARRRWPLLALVLLAPVIGACPEITGRSDIGIAEALLEIEDALAGLREESAILQAQIDSLRGVVARHDTALRQIGNLTGVPVPAR